MDTILTLTEYSQYLGISEECIKGHSRKHEHKIPRHLYWFYLNKNGIGKRSIAREFNRVHSSIVNGINTISDLIETQDVILLNYKGFISTFLHLQDCNWLISSNFIKKTP